MNPNSHDRSVHHLVCIYVIYLLPCSICVSPIVWLWCAYLFIGWPRLLLSSHFISSQQPAILLQHNTPKSKGSQNIELTLNFLVSEFAVWLLFGFGVRSVSPRWVMGIKRDSNGKWNIRVVSSWITREKSLNITGESVHSFKLFQFSHEVERFQFLLDFFTTPLNFQNVISLLNTRFIELICYKLMKS